MQKKAAEAKATVVRGGPDSVKSRAPAEAGQKYDRQILQGHAKIKFGLSQQNMCGWRNWDSWKLRTNFGKFLALTAVADWLVVLSMDP